MRNRKHVLWLGAVAVALGLAWNFLWSAHTPHGQPPLTYLGSDALGQFQDRFDQASSNVRMVLLLSPT